MLAKELRNLSFPVMNITNQSTHAPTTTAAATDNITNTIDTTNTSTNDPPCPWSSTDLECVQQRLWQVVAPVVIVVGIVGNLMVVVVFSRLRFTKSSTLLHMFILAVTDSVILCVGPLRYWVINTYDYDVRTLSNAGCKVGLFVLYVSLDFSSWILVSVTVERALCVLKPLHVRGWFNVRRTLLRLLVIFLLLCVLNGHYFFSNGLIVIPSSDDVADVSSYASAGNFSNTSTVDFSSTQSVFLCSNQSLSTSNNKTIFLSANESLTLDWSNHTDLTSSNTTANCATNSTKVATKVDIEYDCDSLTKKWNDFEEYQFVYIDLCFESVIPFLIMAVCNGFIVVSLKKASKHRPRNTTKRELSRNKPPSFIVRDENATAAKLPPSRKSSREETVHPTTQNPTLAYSDQQLQATSDAPANKAETTTEYFRQTRHHSTESETNNSVDSQANPSYSRSGTVTQNGTALRPNSESDIEGMKRRVSSQRQRLVNSEPVANTIERARDTSLKRKIRKPRNRTSSKRKTPQEPQSYPRDSNPTNQDAALSPGVTRMLVLVTSVFVVTTLPSAIYFIVDSYVREKDVEESFTNSVLDLTQAVTNLLQFTNYSCNFLLYSARSKRFRQEVRYLFGQASKRLNRRRYRSSVLSEGTVHSSRRKHGAMSGADRRQRSSSHLPSLTESELEECTEVSVLPHASESPAVSADGHQKDGSSQDGQRVIRNADGTTQIGSSSGVTQKNYNSQDKERNGKLSADGSGSATEATVADVHLNDGNSMSEHSVNGRSSTVNSRIDGETTSFGTEETESNKQDIFAAGTRNHELGEYGAHAPEVTLISASSRNADSSSGSENYEDNTRYAKPTKNRRKAIRETDDKERLVPSKGAVVVEESERTLQSGFSANRGRLTTQDLQCNQ